MVEGFGGPWTTEPFRSLRMPDGAAVRAGEVSRSVTTRPQVCANSRSQRGLAAIRAYCGFMAPTLALILSFVALLGIPAEAGGAGGAAAWRWPVHGPVVRSFSLGPDPFARGQHRGIDIGAPRGAPVLSACTGVVSFAGLAGSNGPTVSVRCGALVATYLHLGSIAVHGGATAAAGHVLATVGDEGLHLGARQVAGRWAYVDPLALLGGDGPGAPPLGVAPRGRRAPPAAGPARPVPAPVVVPAPPMLSRVRAPALAVPGPAVGPGRRVPWPVWAGLALLAAAVPGGWSWRRRTRRGSARAPTAVGLE